jgi:hypothetical protein
MKLDSICAAFLWRTDINIALTSTSTVVQLVAAGCNACI